MTKDRIVRQYRISELVPYINWLYFYHAWGLSGKPRCDKEKMQLDMLASWEDRFHSHAIFQLFDANSDGDDILFLDRQLRFPMLRQQHPSAPGAPNLCLADFIRPLSLGKKDQIGVFCSTVDGGIMDAYRHDDYLNMMAQTLCDRLAEATAEKLHEEVRKTYWGYAPEEHLTIEQHPTSHRLSFAAGHECEFPHRPATRYEAGGHPTHGKRNDDAPCQCVGTDVRPSYGEIFRIGQDRG